MSTLGTLKSQHALAVRHHGADSPQARDTKKKLAAEKTAVYIERLLREAPELDASSAPTWLNCCDRSASAPAVPHDAPRPYGAARTIAATIPPEAGPAAPAAATHRIIASVNGDTAGDRIAARHQPPAHSPLGRCGCIRDPLHDRTAAPVNHR